MTIQSSGIRSIALIASIATCGIFANGAFTPAGAVGILLTSEAGYTGPSLDLTPYANGSYNFTAGPEPIPGGITFTSTGGNQGGSILGQGGYGLNENGFIDNSAVYAGLDSGTNYMQFSFAAPVSSFGAFLNYALIGGSPVGNNPTISTYDASNNLLSTFDLFALAPISTPFGINEFQFRGIDEGSAIISSFRLSGSFIVAAGTANGGIPQSQAVPEPFTIIGTIVGGTAALRIRKKLKEAKK